MDGNNFIIVAFLILLGTKLSQMFSVYISFYVKYGIENASLIQGGD